MQERFLEVYQVRYDGQQHGSDDYEDEHWYALLVTPAQAIICWRSISTAMATSNIRHLLCFQGCCVGLSAEQRRAHHLAMYLLSCTSCGAQRRRPGRRS